MGALSLFEYDSHPDLANERMSLSLSHTHTRFIHPGLDPLAMIAICYGHGLFPSCSHDMNTQTMIGPTLYNVVCLLYLRVILYALPPQHSTLTTQTNNIDRYELNISYIYKHAHTCHYPFVHSFFLPHLSFFLSFLIPQKALISL